jgi:hypothetical protein
MAHHIKLGHDFCVGDDELRDAAGGARQVVDLTITIAFYNAVVRVLATLQIDVEDDYMPYLRQFPLLG